jgi:hypothetical protein
VECAAYNAHTSPIFKFLRLLKISDIFVLAKLKFYHKYCNNQLPRYMQEMPIKQSNEIHSYNTRRAAQGKLYTPKANHVFAQNCVRHNIILTVNDLPQSLYEKVATHSLKGLATYFKTTCIENYEMICQNGPNCYVCHRI